jgi:hypothetical protein
MEKSRIRNTNKQPGSATLLQKEIKNGWGGGGEGRGMRDAQKMGVGGREGVPGPQSR